MIENGLLIALLGMAITFAVMALLIGFICLFKLLALTRKPAQDNEEQSESMPDFARDADAGLVAAITAAVAMMLETEQPKPGAGFIVRSIRRL